MNDPISFSGDLSAPLTRSDRPATLAAGTSSRQTDGAQSGSIPSGSTVLVADAKPLSLMATAGVLHHAGMRCICARTAQAVLQACGISPTTSSEALRVDEAATGLPTDSNAKPVRPGAIDLIVWDVGDDVTAVLQTLTEIRERFPDLPAVLIASSKWAGLEKKTEDLHAPTRCLFQPIDPASLVAVCEPLLWMPALQSMHRQRGSRPNRPGWVTL